MSLKLSVSHPDSYNNKHWPGPKVPMKSIPEAAKDGKVPEVGSSTTQMGAWGLGGKEACQGTGGDVNYGMQKDCGDTCHKGKALLNSEIMFGLLRKGKELILLFCNNYMAAFVESKGR